MRRHLSDFAALCRRLNQVGCHRERGSPFTIESLLIVKNKLWVKITGWIGFLQTLGGWGLLALAALDGAAIPIPIDALVAGYVFARPYRAWIYVIAAAMGSALGSVVPYCLGRAGGELFLLRRIKRERLERIRDRFERQEFLALMLPAMLPPPTPFKLFVFSAGVFEMRPLWFVGAIISGRLIRFGAVAGLTIAFGPQIVSNAKTLMLNHPSLVISVVIAVIAFAYVLFRLLRGPAREVAREMEGGGNSGSS